MVDGNLLSLHFEMNVLSIWRWGRRTGYYCAKETWLVQRDQHAQSLSGLKMTYDLEE